MVSGIAALSLFENRYLKSHQVKQVLVDSLLPIPALDGKLITAGVVDPTAAIALAKVTTPATSKPVVPSRSLASTSQADSSSSGGGGGCGLVAATGGNFPPSSGGPNGPLVALLFLPLAIALGLRQRQTIYS
jgi:hypothetical protein